MTSSPNWRRVEDSSLAVKIYDFVTASNPDLLEYFIYCRENLLVSSQFFPYKAEARGFEPLIPFQV